MIKNTVFHLFIISLCEIECGLNTFVVATGLGIPLMPLVVVAWLIGHETPNYPRVGVLVWV